MPLDQQQLQHLSHLELLAKQVVEGFITGLHKSPFHGFSVEFAEHRIYNSGEPTRHIDWKLFGKTDKLFVKRYEEETNLRCQIVIDDSSSMYFGSKDGKTKLIFSIHCAGALAYLLKKQRDAVGLSVFSDKVELHTQAKSNYAHQKMLFAELEKLLVPISEDEHKKSFTATSLHEIAESIHKRSLVIIFSDMMSSLSPSGGGGGDDIFSALQHLRHNKHEVILFHVVDKSKELDFEFENRPYNFIDMETGERVKVHPSEIKETYVRSMAEYKKELMLHCAQYRIDFVEADIKEGFQQVLMPYLIKRSKMQ
ncbi:MAG: DUF58 domain-containing protein [Bacteroidetes bacterium]|nr:DUF58 domain-containing protein [Bacteroidota bacterium]